MTSMCITVLEKVTG